MKYRMGIDVGGTNTDAVILDEKRNVVAETKVPTSGDVYTGIMEAVRTVLRLSGIDALDVDKAMLGTTQCTNAIVERKSLAQVALVRLGAPATTGIDPMTDWPMELKQVCRHWTVIGGG